MLRASTGAAPITGSALELLARKYMEKAGYVY